MLLQKCIRIGIFYLNNQYVYQISTDAIVANTFSQKCQPHGNSLFYSHFTY